jgi:hypothetical protein
MGQDTDTETISYPVRFSPAEYDLLEKLATSTERSRAGVIRWLLKREGLAAGLITPAPHGEAQDDRRVAA